LEAIKDGLCAAVAVGTGWRSRLPGIRVCGKTGSAQVVGRAALVHERDNPRLLAHAWFVAFAPADNPLVAVAVLVENGGSGGQTAAPVARKILASYFRLASVDPAASTTGRVSSVQPEGRGEPAVVALSRP